MPTSVHDLWSAILQSVPRNEWVDLETIYRLLEADLTLQPSDLNPSAPGNADPTWHRNTRNALQQHKTSDILWGHKGHYYFPSQLADPTSLADAEKALRQLWWQDLTEAGGPNAVPPQVLRQMGIYRGAQGIWVDKDRTQALTPAGPGVAVSVLHTGHHYPDDLAEDGLIYHYPDTDRPPARDVNEVDATKAAAQLSIPLFVITHNSESASLRDVRKSWVASFDEASAQFLIVFQDEPPRPPAPPQPESETFQARLPRDRRPRGGSSPARKAAFRFDVIKRYGPECAVCGIHLLQTLDAVHIIPVEEDGADDARNGLPLCATHHRAFDAQLFAIEPETFRIETRRPVTLEQLRIERATLRRSAHRPHKEALSWRWAQWKSFNR